MAHVRGRWGCTTVTVSTLHYDEATDVETDIDVTCSVSPEDRSCGAAAEVEIIEAIGSDGRDWTERIVRDARWFDRIYDDAVTAACEDDSPYDTREEARGER